MVVPGSKNLSISMSSSCGDSKVSPCGRVAACWPLACDLSAQPGGRENPRAPPAIKITERQIAPCKAQGKWSGMRACWQTLVSFSCWIPPFYLARLVVSSRGHRRKHAALTRICAVRQIPLPAFVYFLPRLGRARGRGTTSQVMSS